MANVTNKIKAAVGHIIDKGTHIDVAKTTQLVAKKFGLSERLINYTHIEIQNKLNEYDYKRSSYKNRILFLPHCMRHSKHCKAKYNDEGLQCRDCGKCKLTQLRKLAVDAGYSYVFITPGGSMVRKLINKYKPKAVMGVCCYDEANLAFERLRGTNIAPQAVLLLKDGCKDTDVNIEEVREKLLAIDSNANA